MTVLVYTNDKQIMSLNVLMDEYHQDKDVNFPYPLDESAECERWNAQIFQGIADHIILGSAEAESEKAQFIAQAERARARAGKANSADTIMRYLKSFHN